MLIEKFIPKSQYQSKTHRSQRITLLVVMMFVLAVTVTRCERMPSLVPSNLEPRMTYEVVNTYPHDPNAFTQGLIYLDGFLYESTGLYGESSLRKVVLETGEILQQVDLPPAYFAEGLTAWEDLLVQLTWREETGFIYDQADFILQGQFSYPTEGWGLTHDGERLIMSDGSDALFFLDPETYEITGSVDVAWQGDPVYRLNELEFIWGEVYANVWQTEDIIRINPNSGEVTGWIDMRGILPAEERTPETDVLNGIAYDPEGDRLFITGKLWPLVFEVALVPVSESH